MTPARPRLLLIRAALLALAGGVAGCFGAEMEIPEISLSQTDLRFRGLPASEDGSDLTLTTNFTGRTGKFQLSPSVETEVTSSYAVITAGSGITDLGFIRSFRVTIEGTGAGSLPIRLNNGAPPFRPMP